MQLRAALCNNEVGISQSFKREDLRLGAAMIDDVDERKSKGSGLGLTPLYPSPLYPPAFISREKKREHPHQKADDHAADCANRRKEQCVTEYGETFMFVDAWK